MDVCQQLQKKIELRKAIIGIIGLGYVGLPLVSRFLEQGFSVIGFDIDHRKIKSLKKGKSYIKHIEIKPFKDGMAESRFDVTSDFSYIAKVDVVILCVPTPLNRNREPDISFIVGSVENILPHIHAGQLISLESTTYPGTTEEELRTRIEGAGFTVGKDFFITYSPEREDPVNPDYSTRTIPKVCGGSTPHCLEVGKILYSQVVDQVVPVASTQMAEMVKILENTYRAVNIALVNELKLVADRMGLDIFEVIRAAATKPFGFTPFFPGPGLGGHCIPIDPFFLTWKAREYGINTRFIELAGEVNSSMPSFVVGKVVEALNHHGKAVKGAKILILGVAYKKNVDDMRESPSLVIIEELRKKGGVVSYSDPYVPSMPSLRRTSKLKMDSVALDKKNLESFDCVVVATDHDAFDWDSIKESCKLIVDPRGIFYSHWSESNIWRA